MDIQQGRDIITAERVRAITVVYPQFAGMSVRPVNETGQYNDAFVVGERLIFRFPRYKEGVANMRREVSFLKAIAGRTTLPVPEPAYMNLNAEEPGQVFMGYSLLPGQPLWRPTLQSERSEQVLQMWAEQLAGFLRELHALPVTDFEAPDPPAEAVGEWQAMYGEVCEHLFPQMRSDARREIAMHFETYLADTALHGFQPSPRHGDFGSGNILYDPASKEITGIIDFGYAAVGDPAMDVAAASTLGASLFERFEVIYPETEMMMPRVRFYRGTYALFEALHGFKSGDREAFDAGMSRYI